MGRILAIDYGEKRIGLALTDVLQISINPLQTITPADFDAHIDSLTHGKELTDIVFGYPTHADGRPTKVAGLIDKKIESLTRKYPDIRIHKIDEAFSSQRASSIMVQLGVKKGKRREKAKIDQMSAVLILKDFIENQ